MTKQNKNKQKLFFFSWTYADLYRRVHFKFWMKTSLQTVNNLFNLWSNNFQGNNFLIIGNMQNGFIGFAVLTKKLE